MMSGYSGEMYGQSTIGGSKYPPAGPDGTDSWQPWAINSFCAGESGVRCLILGADEAAQATSNKQSMDFMGFAFVEPVYHSADRASGN